MGTGDEDDNEESSGELLLGGVVDSCQAAVLERGWDRRPSASVAAALPPASLVTPCSTAAVARGPVTAPERRWCAMAFRRPGGSGWAVEGTLWARNASGWALVKWKVS